MVLTYAVPEIGGQGELAVAHHAADWPHLAINDGNARRGSNILRKV
jgi:hypothetical protein